MVDADLSVVGRKTTFFHRWRFVIIRKRRMNPGMLELTL
jgi:hypothetical protein